MLVLLIDDDIEDYEIFSEALKEVNPLIRCLGATDGLHGYNLLTRELILPPDYIFLDVNMPLMDGKELLIKIKSEEALKDVPVIMYSTTTNSEEISRFKHMGAKDFLIKPPDFISLVEELKARVI